MNTKYFKGYELADDASKSTVSMNKVILLLIIYLKKLTID